MQFFIDTANLEQIRRFKTMGLLDGVTTDPTLAAEERGDFRRLLGAICETMHGPVLAEVVAADADQMFAEARELASVSKHVVVTLPTGPEGIRALTRCVDAGIPTHMTMVFQPAQALVMAKIGATYVSPFLGRLEGIGRDPMELLQTIRTIYDNCDLPTQILAAGLRHPLDVVQAAQLGADVASLSPAVLEKLLDHPLTDGGRRPSRLTRPFVASYVGDEEPYSNAGSGWSASPMSMELAGCAEFTD